MDIPTTNLILQTAIFSFLVVPHMFILLYGVYRIWRKQEKRREKQRQRETESKSNDFRFNDFEGDNASLALNNNHVREQHNHNHNYKPKSSEVAAIEALQQVITILQKEKEAQAEVIAAQSDVIDGLRNELYEYKFYNLPLWELNENKQKT
ncbi:hypothetical protein [Pontibacter beigongshangensis]|uniref:hypothetical protein n=1 Tax=Pontibacter beigongshangensis TaxID=2574733 RepID=UPI0016509291|nr:hypothetical protein [Pontibacter beigongshangensis]